MEKKKRRKKELEYWNGPHGPTRPGPDRDRGRTVDRTVPGHGPV
jgi:hypothetical protein